MWRPDAVVSEHKRRAIALWVLLIVGIVVYASWVLALAVKKRNNPSTSLVLSNKVYSYPDTWVCLYDSYGCDEMEREERCMNSSTLTEGGNTTAIFYPGGDYEQEIAAVGRLTDTNGWCVEFKTSDVTVFEGQERLASNYLDYFLLDMYWYPGGTAGASTTCIPDGEEWTPHREWVYLFLNDPATNVPSTGIQVSYSCITNQSNSHVFTYLGLGLTEQDNIKGDNSFTYKALSLSSATYKDNVKSNLTSPYAHLAMEIQQEPSSFEIITEVDPLDVAELLGNIGGFWDPHLKPRDFKKSAEWAAERARDAAESASIPRPVGGATTFEGVRPTISASGRVVERPYWDTTISPHEAARNLEAV